MYDESLRFKNISCQMCCILLNLLQLNLGRVGFKEHYMGQQQRRDDLDDLLTEILDFTETFSSLHIFFFVLVQEKSVLSILQLLGFSILQRKCP